MPKVRLVFNIEVIAPDNEVRSFVEEMLTCEEVNLRDFLGTNPIIDVLEWNGISKEG